MLFDESFFFNLACKTRSYKVSMTTREVQRSVVLRALLRVHRIIITLTQTIEPILKR